MQERFQNAAALEEQGMLKSVSNALRAGSFVTDLIPLDAIPGVGTLVSEGSAAALAGLAGGVDTVGKVLEGDIGGAGEEFVMGLADTAGAALPGAEWVRAATLGNINLRKMFRDSASGTYNYLLDRESTVKLPSSQQTALRNNKTFALSA